MASAPTGTVPDNNTNGDGSVAAPADPRERITSFFSFCPLTFGDEVSSIVKQHLEDGATAGELPLKLYMHAGTAKVDEACEALSSTMGKRKRDTRQMALRAMGLSESTPAGTEDRVPLRKVEAAAASLDAAVSAAQYAALDPATMEKVQAGLRTAHGHLARLADRNLDKMEIYLLRNVFHIPDNLVVDSGADGAGAASGDAGAADADADDQYAEATAEDEAAMQRYAFKQLLRVEARGFSLLGCSLRFLLG